MSPSTFTIFEREWVVRKPVPNLPVDSALFDLPSEYLYNNAKYAFPLKGSPLCIKITSSSFRNN